MNIRAALQRDSIIFKNISTGSIYLDTSLNKFIYDHRIDDYIFRKVANECSVIGFEFNTDIFNEFIFSIRDYNSGDTISWDRTLPEKYILPGEIIELNAGDNSFLSLLKLRSGEYLIVDSYDKDLLLKNVSTNGESEFEINGNIFFHSIGDLKISWLNIVLPDRVCRTVDFVNSKLYNRNKVKEDISVEVRRSLMFLHQNEYIKNHKSLLNDFAASGISSFALRKISNSYLKKIN
ncbi:MAG: hypothetical protein K2K81_03775 [Muribaculaceae bacterium]|nr:hypothetical protein [Muribaculaceae bacterium]